MKRNKKCSETKHGRQQKMFGNKKCSGTKNVREQKVFRKKNCLETGNFANKKCSGTKRAWKQSFQSSIVITDLCCFWQRAPLKGPKRSFVVLVILVVGMETWAKNVTKRTKNVCKWKLLHNYELFDLLLSCVAFYCLLWLYRVNTEFVNDLCKLLIKK